VKYVPEWFPGASFQKKAREWRVPVRNMLNQPYEAAKEKYVSYHAYQRLTADKRYLAYRELSTIVYGLVAK